MISHWLILCVQVAATLLIAAALTSGLFVIIAFMLLAILSPIQSITAAFAQKGMAIIAFCFAAVPSLLVLVALYQRPDLIAQCQRSGCSSLADGLINALPSLALHTLIPFLLCVATMFWGGMGTRSQLSMSARLAVGFLAFSPLIYTVGASNV